MSIKFIRSCMLIATVCLILLGAMFKNRAKDYQGVAVSSGIMINGTYSQTNSGTIGRNQKAYDKFNNTGTVFYVLGGVTGAICIVTFIKKKDS